MERMFYKYKVIELIFPSRMGIVSRIDETMLAAPSEAFHELGMYRLPEIVAHCTLLDKCRVAIATIPKHDYVDEQCRAFRTTTVAAWRTDISIDMHVRICARTNHHRWRGQRGHTRSHC